MGRPSMKEFDPFIMLDDFRGKSGFPDHPHRGFETVTYMLEGTFAHEDFTGHKGTIGPGDAQWMTAGRGIVHAEMPANPGEYLHALQLWVNLSAKNKMCAPRYQERKAADIPHTTVNGVTAAVLAGTALGLTSSVETVTPSHYVHFTMEPHSTLRHPIPENMNAFLFILEGTAEVGDVGPTHVVPRQFVTLRRGGDGVVINTTDQRCSFMFLAGEPLDEPIASGGPFVMNTEEQLQNSFRDYQYKTNGFEPARSWRSEIGRRR